MSFAYKVSWVNYLNSGHCVTFLYYLIHEILQSDKNHLEGATRIFLLNKALNDINSYFEIEMLKAFLIRCTIGVVSIKADYEKSYIFQQG